MTGDIDTGASPAFKLTNQYNWPHEDFCATYSFSLVGGWPNQMLLAATLTPKTKSGQVDVRTRLVLWFMLQRLYFSRIRNKRKHLPEYGDYRYIWLSQTEMAMQLALSEDQVKRSITCLVNAQILYSVRQNRSEPCAYRLTDEAFMMAHALQYPVLKGNWIVHKNWEKLEEIEYDKELSRKYSTICKEGEEELKLITDQFFKLFPKLVNELQPFFEKWHTEKHSTGRKLTPYELGLIERLDTLFSKHLPEVLE